MKRKQFLCLDVIGGAEQMNVTADDAARLLRLEHARAVKVVKALKDDSMHIAPWEKLGYRKALADVLTALQRGRTQKGTR